MTFIQPVYTEPTPRGLTLNQFLQTVLVGISGLPGTMVRPKWQVEPPKQPDICVNWLAFGIDSNRPDANSYLGVKTDGSTDSQRHETLSLGLSFYGFDALEIYGLVRDGFQVSQNRDTLFRADMGFVEITEARQMPELVHERWIERWVANVVLRREVKRIYAIPTIVSANGVIHTVLGNEEYLLNWTAGGDE